MAGYEVAPSGTHALGDPLPVGGAPAGPPMKNEGDSQIRLNAPLATVGAVAPRKYTLQSPDAP